MWLVCVWVCVSTAHWAHPTDTPHSPAVLQELGATGRPVASVALSYAPLWSRVCRCLAQNWPRTTKSVRTDLTVR